MFDPVTLIVAALVRGLLAGVEGVVAQAVVDGYTVLTGQLVGRYGPAVGARIEALRADPHSMRHKAEVAAALRAAGADRDPELHLLARRLNELVDNPERIINGSASVDPVEQLKKFTGLRVVGQALESHIGRVLAVRAHYSVEDTDLLTANVGAQQAIPAAERAGLGGLHQHIRQVIESVATQIEDSRYREVERAVVDLPTGLAERNRAARLVHAEKNLHSSYESLRLTVEFLGELNRSILARIETEDSPHTLSNMMFGNAVLIYELADFVIGYVRSFSLVNSLEPLHAEATARLRHARESQQALLARLESDAIDEAVREHTMDSIRGRENAINELEREWDEYLADVRNMERAVDDVRRKLPTLEVIKENARIQIVTLQLVALLRLLKQNDRSIQGAVDTLAGFQLAPLTPARVRRLLGM